MLEYAPKFIEYLSSLMCSERAGDEAGKACFVANSRQGQHYLVLATHIPDSEADVLVLDSLHIESYRLLICA